MESKLRIAKVNCGITKELCQILPVKAKEGPILVFFRKDFKAYQYTGPLSHDKIMTEFIEEDKFK
jgi:hypothetical protein